MFTINETKLSGFLVYDARPGKTKSNNSISNYRIAVPIPGRRRSRGRSGAQSGRREKTADFFNVSSYGAAADFANERFKKGMQVYIEGSLRTDEYTTKDGRRVSEIAIIAHRQEIVDRRRGGAVSSEEEAAVAEAEMEAES